MWPCKNYLCQISLRASFIFCTLLLSAFAIPTQPDNSTMAKAPSLIYLIDINGPIGPANHDHLSRSLKQAALDNPHLIVIQLNTPGGLVSSMRAMTQEILNAPAPVVVYVAPSGSYAASAGAFITYAAPIASMAPGTNIGAASPVSLGPDITAPQPPTETQPNAAEQEPSPTPSTMQVKAIEDLSAYMRSLADLNKRNAQLGVEMITKGRAFSAQQALDNTIINFISTDLDELLQQLDGYALTFKGQSYVITTTNRAIVQTQTSWRYGFLKIITDPNVTYILLIAGIYGILFELYSPGALFPGILGTICIVLAGYGLHLLPINYAGLFLVIVGIVLLTLELFVTSYGLLGVGGLVAFVFGSVFLLDTLYPVYSVSATVITSVATLSLLTLAIIARFLLGTARRAHLTGSDGMIGKPARALSTFTQYGSVMCDGSIYSADTTAPLKKNQSATVIAVTGLRLTVKPVNP